LTEVDSSDWPDQKYRDMENLWDDFLNQLESFVITPELKSDRPVMFPPGRARLVTRPVPTGSAPAMRK
jgi:hypothetical protein